MSKPTITTRDRECAEVITHYFDSPNDTRKQKVEAVATILAAEREKEREVLNRLQDTKHHMDDYRALVKCPEDYTLYEWLDENFLK